MSQYNFINQICEIFNRSQLFLQKTKPSLYFNVLWSDCADSVCLHFKLTKPCLTSFRGTFLIIKCLSFHLGLLRHPPIRCRRHWNSNWTRPLHFHFLPLLRPNSTRIPTRFPFPIRSLLLLLPLLRFLLFLRFRFSVRTSLLSLRRVCDVFVCRLKFGKVRLGWKSEYFYKQIIFYSGWQWVKMKMCEEINPEESKSKVLIQQDFQGILALNIYQGI